MDFMKKRKLKELLDGLGSRADKTTSSSSLASESDTVLATDSTPAQAARSFDPSMPPQTPPSNNRTSNSTLDSVSSTIRTPGSGSMALRYSLSTLSRPTNTNTNTNTAENELLAKRRRLGLPNSPSKDLGSNPGSATSGPTTISNVVLRKWPGNKDEKKPLFKPKYCPGDRDELLRRLVTFQELTDWTPKPDAVNEVQWARRGWICNGKERVRCTLCNKELVVKLNKKEIDGKEVAVLVPSEIEEAMVQKYLELMVTSHGEDCLWRKRGCEDSLLRLPLSNRQNAIHDLRKRYDDLCMRNSFLPYEFNLRLPEKLNLDTVLSQLPPDFFTVPAPPNTNTASSTPNRVALALAILGWEGLDNARIGPVPNSASCHTCLRRLGLWMFKSKEIDPETNTVLVPAPMDHLDPVREHRFFCPWKSADAQRLRADASSSRRRLGTEEDDLPGWEVLLQVIRNEAYLRGRDNPTKKGAQDGSPRTPRRFGIGGGQDRDSPYGSTPGGEDGEDDEEDEKVQGEQDQQRRTKLRKLRNLLSASGANKLRKSLSRPGTSHSTHQGEGATANEAAAERPPTAGQHAT